MSPRILRHVVESLDSLRLFKLRTALALLGILIGTASVVALVSSSQLATQHALEQFKSLGTDLFTVSLQNPPSQETTLQDQNLKQLANLTTTVPEIALISPYAIDYPTLSFAGKPIQAGLISATETLKDMMKITLAEGRFISHLDKTEYFCVIGANVARIIRASGVQPLHQQIRVEQQYCTIIGIAKPWTENMFLNANVNNSIILPLAAAAHLNKSLRIQHIIFKLQTDTNADTIQPRIERMLKSIFPTTQFFLRSSKQLITSMEKQRQTFSLLILAIGGISLIVGGLGIMNIMLVSVLERRREIGIRMAVGARRRDIQQLFLIESLVLTFLGGLLGIIIGIAVSFGIAVFSHWTFHLYSLPLFVGFGVSLLVGVFFGYYPAYSAARLDPIVALRTE